MAIDPDRPVIFIVDDDRAVLSLMGTGVSCLEVLRALRRVSPQCEAVLTTGGASNITGPIDIGK